MAEYGSIPARLNGVPIPELGAISVTMQRTVNQVATSSGPRIVFGQPKYSAQITFPHLANKALFLAAVGADAQIPDPFNLGYDMGGRSFALGKGICSGTTAQSDQDGQASLQITAVFENFQAE